MNRQVALQRIVLFVLIAATALGSLVEATIAATANTTTTLAPEHQLLGGKCGPRASCGEQRSRRLELDGGADKRACHCDDRCVQYDDCCADSPKSLSLERRIQMGELALRQIRQQWHCHRVNPIFGDVLLKASCAPAWLANQTDQSAANLVRRRCEYVKDRGKRHHHHHHHHHNEPTSAALHSDKDGHSSNQQPSPEDEEPQLDPIGAMMPITDLASGTTYANSYCLRCNLLGSGKQQRLVYWSPLLECKYDMDSEDRNTLYDLISANKGQVLHYSSERNTWVMNVPAPATTADKQQKNATEPAKANSSSSNSNSSSSERVCSITPTIPDSVEHIIRFCRANTIDSCPTRSAQTTGGATNATSASQAELECHFGHQALVYSQTGSAVYYNLGCAKCNGERQVFCEKKKPRKSQLAVSKTVIHHQQNGSSSGNQNDDRILFAPASDQTDEDNDDTGDNGDEDSSLDNEAARSGVGSVGSSLGSFSVLLDVHSSSQGDEQVGAVHQCPDPENQVYDWFLRDCRDIVCGLNQHYVDGKCVVSMPEHRLDDHQLLSAAELTSHSNSTQDNADGQQHHHILESSIHRSSSQASMQDTGKSDGQLVPNRSAATLDGEPRLVKANRTGRLESSSSGAPLVEQSTVAAIVVSVAPFGGHDKPTGVNLTVLPAATTATVSHVSITTTTVATNGDPDEATSTGRSLSVNLRPLTQSAGSDDPAAETRTLTITTAAAAAHRPDDGRPEEVVESGGETQRRPAVVSARLELSTPKTQGLDTNTAADFELDLAKLVVADELPQPTAESRRLFAECGKILIKPQHYRLFTVTIEPAKPYSTNESTLTQVSTHLRAAGEQQLHVAGGKQSDRSNKLWARIVPYNLTLASSQFELVRPASNATQFDLLICSPFSSDLVDKFKPAMVYITTTCLVVSIASLALYLLLYWLSMFDLRRLAAAIEEPMGKRGRSRPRGSNATMISATSSTSARSQSLSSRAVACLAASLLAAYLLFIAGHQRELDPPEPGAPASLVCVAIAIATYYFFLVAFNWMFLLSYDIWRTLRLATCHLRGPAGHSQSVRFITYLLLALLASAALVGTALLIDQAPFVCQSSPPTGATDNVVGTTLSPLGATAAMANTTCVPPKSQLGSFLQSYRPKFGQRAGSCWFSNRRALALFFGLPVTLIMILNLLFFLHSSFMVLKTSSKSSHRLTSTSPCHHNNPNASPKFVTMVSRFDSTIESDSTVSQFDFTHQNSLTTNSMVSVQTLESHLSQSSDEALSSGDDDSPSQRPPTPAKRQEPARRPEQKVPVSSQPAPPPKRRLESTQSSSSLTNQSIGGVSMANSVALKYDSHLQSLSSAMSSLVKDYRLYCRLSTIMGLTWLTGLVASLVDQSDALWYLFVVLNTLQGLFIFIAFGCKRSKLANLQILLAYLQFKWRLLCCSDPHSNSPEPSRRSLPTD